MPAVCLQLSAMADWGPRADRKKLWSIGGEARHRAEHGRGYAREKCSTCGHPTEQYPHLAAPAGPCPSLGEPFLAPLRRLPAQFVHSRHKLAKSRPVQHNLLQACGRCSPWARRGRGKGRARVHIVRELTVTFCLLEVQRWVGRGKELCSQTS